MFSISVPKKRDDNRFKLSRVLILDCLASCFKIQISAKKHKTVFGFISPRNTPWEIQQPMFLIYSDSYYRFVSYLLGDNWLICGLRPQCMIFNICLCFFEWCVCHCSLQNIVCGVICFKWKYQESLKIVEYPLHQLIQLGRLEIHISFPLISFPYIDVPKKDIVNEVSITFSWGRPLLKGCFLLVLIFLSPVNFWSAAFDQGYIVLHKKKKKITEMVVSMKSFIFDRR